MTTMKMRTTRCGGCPFARASIPGYLGSYTGPEDFLATHYYGEILNPCHEATDYADPDWKDNLKVACRGQAQFFTNNCKSPRSANTRALVGAVEGDPGVFQRAHQFNNHHGPDDDDGKVDAKP